jgi:hypothetical protein
VRHGSLEVKTTEHHTFPAQLAHVAESLHALTERQSTFKGVGVEAAVPFVAGFGASGTADDHDGQGFGGKVEVGVDDQVEEVGELEGWLVRRLRCWIWVGFWLLTIFWRSSVGRVEKVVGDMLEFFWLGVGDDSGTWRAMSELAG